MSSSGVGGSRVSIPNNVRKLIQNIREITGKQHSDDEIFAVLTECSMDPNETAQKLLYLDTFHEVKRRRDRGKENLNSKASEERSTLGTQRRGPRGGGQGNYGSNFASDAGGGKNAARRENGANHTADRGSSALPFLQRTKNNAAPRATKSLTSLSNGTANLSNGTSHNYARKSSVDSEGPSPSDVNKLGPASVQPAALGVTSSPTFVSMNTEQQKSDEHLLNLISGVHSSDSLSIPSDGASTAENEAGRQQLADEPSHIDEKTVFEDNVSSGQSESDKAVNGAVNNKSPNNPKTSETLQPPPLSTLEAITSEVAAIAAEISSQLTSESHVSDGQHVTFPNHFQVPEALKSGLTFGSFDASFGPKVESVSFGADDNMGVAESSDDGGEASKEPSPSGQNVSSVVQGDYLDDNSQSLPHVLEKLPLSEDSTDSKVEQSKQETQFPPEGPQNPSAINGTSYGLGIMPPMVGSQLVQMEGHEAQAHESRVPNFANGNSLAPPSTNASPPLPNSIPVSPQTVPVFRQTYPNFFPYGQYISPFYMPPMHQFPSHNGFPPQPSSGNVYLQPAPTGVKFSLPQFKPGNNGTNRTHIGIPPAGSFITAAVGYTQPVSSGSSMGNEDLVSSHLKENQIYTTGQLIEGSAVWIHAAGQDMPSLQVNSLYNLPQGHIAFSPQQSGHGTFAGIFPHGHAMTTPSTLLQQSQAMAGTIETIGPPSGAYQQPHSAQINWNAAF